MYNMNLLKTYHASLLEMVAKFLELVDKVMTWASVEFVNDIVYSGISFTRVAHRRFCMSILGGGISKTRLWQNQWDLIWPGTSARCGRSIALLE